MAYALLALACAVSASAQTLLNQHWANYIVPVDSQAPDFAYGTQTSANIAYFSSPSGGRSVATYVVFDNIPVVTGATRCTVNLDYLPGQPFNSITGVPTFGIYEVPITAGYVGLATTWNNAPKYNTTALTTVKMDGSQGWTFGAYVPCGTVKKQFALVPDKAGDFNLTFFELNDPANGLFNGITFKQWA